LPQADWLSARVAVKGEPMHRHDPSCLEGPVSRLRGCWQRTEEGGIRRELVERVRREIAEGAYDTPDKMEIALARLLKRLEAD
jgi:hypothetical protein